jgi:hypothetical protein
MSGLLSVVLVSLTLFQLAPISCGDEEATAASSGIGAGELFLKRFLNLFFNVRN